MNDSVFAIKADLILADTLLTTNSKSFAALTDSAFLDSTNSKKIQPLQVNTLFKTHRLQVNQYYPQTIEKQNPDWFTFILLTIIIAITFLKVFYSKIFFQIFKAFVNNNTANQIVRDENVLVQRASILLSVICYLVFALFTYKITQFYNYENQYMGQGFVKFLFIAIFVGIAYSVKMISLKLFGSIFNYEKPTVYYIFNLFLINNVLGMVLLPLLILLTYLNSVYFVYTLNICIAIIALFFLYRLLKGILIYTSIPRSNLFYLFLYICALEIAPLLIIYKIISL